MKSVKVFFRYTSHLPGVGVSYLGPGLMTVWALRGDAQMPLFSAKTISKQSDLGKAALDLWEKLKSKGDFEASSTTFLTDCSYLLGLSFLDKAIVVLPDGVVSRDQRRAEVHHEQWGQELLRMLEFEYPQIPFASGDDSMHLRAVKKFGSQDLYHSDHELVQRGLAKKKILLHVCCGPDAAGVINQLKRDYEVLCFWYDPNIQPKEEHDLRMNAFRKVADIEQVPYVEGEYDVQHFFSRIQGLEHTPEQGAKCSVCYDMRLERTAVEAQRQGCDLYTTTLAISPHKVQEKLKNFGMLYARKYGVDYLATNFMKNDGFKKSAEYTREYDIYRQDYCGCYFSMHEGGITSQKEATKYQVQKDQLKPGYVNPYLEAQPTQETL